MQVQTQIEISDAEWEVMRVVWTLGATTSHVLIRVLNEKMGWKAGTVKTLLGRLVKKGALVPEKQGRAFLYKPQVEEQVAIDNATTSLFHHLCQMRRGKAVSNLLDDLTLSQTDIQRLQAQLAEKLKTAPEMVPCDCLPADFDGHCD
ncbi:transcription regulator [Agrilactobacillus composti DSM 18527 = JCM 14202]|uniref:Transcription regulator n=1 Tax=Agrilactobacillus composti DSM 18527 = JCM 14202 TaxID=1423734 RepID=X0PSM7_9LACO|nr:CopY/TcrY family copper transport repressor [Agrilactobacillus composti]KRM35125.1 transcription regulator [Agrilactobacillus composti DSM 18527 = JCM 14202]GAF40251.1 negative transcriptional regulator-copper transport operon [Agrilactobacillus composti DSM 18527 = JCM 14202]